MVDGNVVDPQFFTAVVVALVGSNAATAFIANWFQRRKVSASASLSKAEATQTLSIAWERSIKSLSVQMETQLRHINELEAKLEDARRRIAEQEVEIMTLKVRLENKS